MYVLVSDATGVNYYVQQYKKKFNAYDGEEIEFRLNGLLDNAMKFETMQGARTMQASLRYELPVSVVPMEIKNKVTK